jgi:hypothetical protein
LSRIVETMQALETGAFPPPSTPDDAPGGGEFPG